MRGERSLGGDGERVCPLRVHPLVQGLVLLLLSRRAAGLRSAHRLGRCLGDESTSARPRHPRLLEVGHVRLRPLAAVIGVVVWLLQPAPPAPLARQREFLLPHGLDDAGGLRAARPQAC
eukprot:3290494-Prymnesium_polylepis.1